ncbi:MAG: YMGG-like glycine zipper-containing protein, partial [Quisquiliibacterium sp.]
MKSISVSTRYAKWLVMISGLCLLGACATAPSGPSALVLPGAGKSFDQFRTDDASCREFAYQQIGGAAAQQNAERKAVQSAVVGTTIGAVAGAALGGSRGAGVGAGTGLVVGSAVGSDAANASAYGAQRRYDQAYVQCMYAAGHKVPVSGSVSSRPSYQSS